MPDHRRISAVSGPSPVRLIAAHLAVIAGSAGATVAAPSAVVRWGATLAAGTSLFALTTLLHEAGHGRLARHRGLNEAAGLLAGWSIFVPVAAARVFERDHQRAPNTPADPQRLLRHRLSVAGGLTAYVLLCHTYAVKTLRGRDRFTYLFELLGLSLLTLLVVAAGLGPLALGAVGVAAIGHNLAIVARHWGRPAGRFRDTWQVVLPAGLSRWLLHADHHLEQHLRPDVRWHDLPLVRAEIDRGGFVADGQRVTLTQFARLVLAGRSRLPVVAEPGRGPGDPPPPRWAGRAAIRARRRQPNHPSRESVVRLASE